MQQNSQGTLLMGKGNVVTWNLSILRASTLSLFFDCDVFKRGDFYSLDWSPHWKDAFLSMMQSSTVVLLH